MMVYRNTPTAMTLYAIPEDEAQAGAAKALGEIRGPRMVSAGNAVWMLYTTTTGVELARYDDQLAGASTAAPEVKGPYDLTASAVFWLESTTLRVATPCLR